MVEVAAAVRALGLEIETVSVGSTPTARGSMTVAGVTECRPGNYVFNDFSQVSLGVCGLEDCAMTAIATVVSVPEAGRAVVDAGSKVLSTDPLRPRVGGHGLVLGTRSRLARLSEEHGVIAVEPGDQFRVGDRVRILPNHTCVVSNLRDRLWTVRGETVEGSFAVAARGRVE
jgi:D-serine deaminase-like pyridoxal phosphate-dependent protein